MKSQVRENAEETVSVPKDNMKPRVMEAEYRHEEYT